MISDFFCVLFQLYPDQIQVLLDAFKSPPTTREEGLYFDDKTFKCVRADKNSIYAKYVSVCDQANSIYAKYVSVCDQAKTPSVLNM